MSQRYIICDEECNLVNGDGKKCPYCDPEIDGCSAPVNGVEVINGICFVESEDGIFLPQG
jgi:hypothetical protein